MFDIMADNDVYTLPMIQPDPPHRKNSPNKAPSKTSSTRLHIQHTLRISLQRSQKMKTNAEGSLLYMKRFQWAKKSRPTMQKQPLGQLLNTQGWYGRRNKSRNRSIYKTVIVASRMQSESLNISKELRST
jgi:hypothetical protein